MEPDEANLPSESDEGFDRADFRVEFSPSPNLEGPQYQPRDNATRPGTGKSPAEASSPPRARTNNDGKSVQILSSIVSGGCMLVMERVMRGALAGTRMEAVDVAC